MTESDTTPAAYQTPKGNGDPSWRAKGGYALPGPTLASIRSLEAAGLREASNSGQGPRRTISLMGATGTGKTTLTRALQHQFTTYVEHHEDNPELDRLMAGDPSFNAFESQRWFLARIEDFVNSSGKAQLVVIDQDPVAVTHVYGRLFFDAGAMDPADYCRLLAHGLAVQRLISRTRSRAIAYLTASPEALRGRTAERSPKRAPDLDWHVSLEKRFADLARHLPLAITLDTGMLTISEATDTLTRLCRARQTKTAAGSTIGFCAGDRGAGSDLVS